MGFVKYIVLVMIFMVKMIGTKETSIKAASAIYRLIESRKRLTNQLKRNCRSADAARCAWNQETGSSQPFPSALSHYRPALSRAPW